MKLRFKRGSAVPKAPEEKHALSPSVVTGPEIREPAPAGAFQRAAKYAEAQQEEETLDEAYVPRRTTLAFRLKTAMPKGMAGRIVLASAGLLTFGGAAVAVAGVRHYLQRDSRFAVATSSEIEIDGIEHLTRSQVLSVFGADLERNIFKVPLDQRRADLEHLPWIQHATVMRLLPNRLRITVVERTPVGFVRQGTELGLVDAQGVLLDMPPQSAGDPKYSFPVLTGLNASDPASVREARMAVYAKFMHELDSGKEKLSQNLSEVDLSNPENVRAVIATGDHDVMVNFGDENFLERYGVYQEHVGGWLKQYPKLYSVDVRSEHQVVLSMDPASLAAANEVPPAPQPQMATGTPASAPAAPAAKPKAIAVKHDDSKSVKHMLAVARSGGKGAAPLAHRDGGH